MIYVFLANGFEETEAIAPIDIMKRAGLQVITVGVGGEIIESTHGIKVLCDTTEDKLCADNDFTAVILPGGMPGTLNLENSSVVQSFIDKAVTENKLVAAICAAPSVLGHKGLLKGKLATCFPGFEQDLEGANVSADGVCRDGNIITAKGAGVALDFGFEIVSYLKDRETANNIEKTMQCK